MKRYLGGRIVLMQGDITAVGVDAIVNAANSALRGGSGVDGAIHRAAGPRLLEECLRVGGCPTGEARITRGYDLPADHVIHTVGPVWSGGEQGEDALLASAYEQSLRVALESGVQTLAFPAISTGVYGFPIERATAIALGTVAAFLEQHDALEQVTFVCFSAGDLAVYERLVTEFV